MLQDFLWKHQNCNKKNLLIRDQEKIKIKKEAMPNVQYIKVKRDAKGKFIKNKK